ncbi:MAG TPA: DUF3488 and transglutaminase-like domain-containing protein [Jatrophihabitantaceae bacterium]
MSTPTEQVLDRLAGPENAARRTLAGLVASALAVLPLHEVFNDWGWLPDVWVAMLLTIGPAAVLRMRWTARGIHLLPGLIITVLYLTARFVPDHAWGHIVPLGGAWSDVATLNRDFHDTVRDSAAPLHSTTAAKMVLAALLVLLAVSVDLVAVVARRPALAGVPFLLLFTLAGAMPRHAVGWLWFVLAAFGYLLLLSSDARDEVSRWGRLMPHTTGASRAAVKALTGRRIAVIAIVVALAIPLMLPIRKSNLLADAIHGGSGGDGGTGLDPFARLKGELNRQDHSKLFDVTTKGPGQHIPLYLAERTLDTYVDSGRDAGWGEGPPGLSEPLAVTRFPADPDRTRPEIQRVNYTATITDRGYKDTAVPLFQSPTTLQGVSGNWSWSRQNGDLLGGPMRPGASYTEAVAEPQPSQQQLLQSKPAVGPDTLRWLQHPTMPSTVVSLVNALTKNKTVSPYERARAILAYFGPDNGFTYSLSTKLGDSGSDLVDFLQNKTGFCQQYAAAMAIMLRLAGVPARVVLGYTHQAPKPDGSFSITSDDSHAWVEAYFSGIGWLPFDPTPLSGADAGRAARIAWAPKPTLTVSSGPATSSSVGHRPQTSDSGTSAAGGGAASQASGDNGAGALVGWLITGIAALILLVGLLPGGVRLWRRRRRLRAAARDPDPLWQELADTAVDLGYVWSPVRTPRQVVTWLRREGVRGPADGSLQALAGAVERSRYAAPQAGVSTQELVRELRRVEVSLRSTRPRWDRIRARLLPPSLGWSRGRRH